MSLQNQKVDAMGKPNVQELWISRIVRDVLTVTEENDKGKVVKQLTDPEVRKMDRWELSALIAKWLAVNDVNPESFLGESQPMPKSLF